MTTNSFETATRVAAIVGAGPGIGSAVAHRFAREGFAVALIARNADRLGVIAKEITNEGGTALPLAADAVDPDAMNATFEQIREQIGAPDVLVYNAAVLSPGAILDIAPADFGTALAVNCLGAFHAVRAALPAMLERGTGTVLLTGGGIVRNHIPGLAALATGKHALRGLAQALAADYTSQGIHVAHVVVDGPVLGDHTRAAMPDIPPEAMLRPVDIAESYWQLHAQPPGAWTAELDLRLGRTTAARGRP